MTVVLNLASRPQMASELTPILLASPAAAATRIIATNRLAEMSACYDVFVAGEAAGLHDFRVALRRLRSWLRAFRNLLDDTVRGKSRRQLRNFAEATNSARDAEVALEWVAAQSDLTAREKPGARYITERYENERESALRTALTKLEGALPPLMKSLARELDSYWVRQSVTKPKPAITMAGAMRDGLTDHSEQLVLALRRIDSPDDFQQIHRARIAAKRLRYLLQTLTGDSVAEELFKKLTELQDVLGHSHDMHVIASRLVCEIGEYAARDARLSALRDLEVADNRSVVGPPFSRVRPGLSALARRAHAGERSVYEQVRQSWRGREAKKVITELNAYPESIGSTNQ